MTGGSPNKTPRTGILLFNMGSPESPENTRPYLKKLFSDPPF